MKQPSRRRVAEIQSLWKEYLSGAPRPGALRPAFHACLLRPCSRRLIAKPQSPCPRPYTQHPIPYTLRVSVVSLLLAALLRADARPIGQPWPRQGVVRIGPASAAALDLFGPAWYYQYRFDGPDIPGHQRVYLIPPCFDDTALIRAMHDHLGAWWLVGNEPNDPAQDNLSPGAYAGFYHRALMAARRADWSAHIVPAGIANADHTWAAAFREAYRAQYGHYPPVAAWNIHNYILEPEFSQYDLAEFQRRVIAFRAWMDAIGEGGKPLLLTEYGALYGSGCCGRPIEVPDDAVAFMRAATQWLQATQYVQAWAWFSLDSSGQFNGDLLDPSGALTPFGQTYAELGLGTRMNAD